jgi:HEAT repeat protein
MVLGCVWLVALVASFLYQPSPQSSLLLPGPAPKTDSSKRPTTTFEDVSLEWGIVPAHQQTTDELSSVVDTLGSGVCVLDLDRDGWMDVLFMGGSGQTQYYGEKAWWHLTRGNRLLRNREGLGFEDVTERAGIPTQEIGMGCGVADLDGDGLQDVILTGLGLNRILRNNGDQTFRDVTAASGMEENRWSTGVSIADFDRDGLLDLYVSNFILFEKHARRFEKAAGFRSMIDPAFDPTLHDPEPNRLYTNLGNFRFRDDAQKLGVANSLGRSLGARWFDLNADRWPDLIVINDHPTPNQVFLNDHGRAFSAADPVLAVLEIAGARDVAIADFDGDGENEIFMSQGMGRPAVLMSREGGEGYSEAAWSRGVAQSRLLPFSGWGTAAADFDNDGAIDLYVANGSLMPDPDSPHVPEAQADTFYANTGEGLFVAQPAESTEARQPLSSRGAVPVDLDNDGRLELLVTHNNDVLQVLAPAGENHGNWITLEIPSDHALQSQGATLVVEAGGRVVNRTIWPAQSFLSQGDPRIHIGLGQSTRIERLRIDWNDGSSSEFDDVPVNQHLSIAHGSHQLEMQPAATQAVAHLAQTRPAMSDTGMESLARIALADPSADRSRRVLEAIWRAAPTAVKLLLLREIAGQPIGSHLAIVRSALLDSAADVRASAVEILRKAELEPSVAWMIPLLDDPDPGVQCAVAAAFRFFFEEEEAVTHRKKLAMKPLIQVLESGPSSARICSADALAAAESKRAIQPLLRQAGSGGDTDVRVASIRALGLIRDRSALEPLRALATSASEEPAVVAASLIALFRLNDPSLTQTFDQVLAPAEGGTRPTRQIEIIAELSGMTDGIVFPREKLRARLGQLARLPTGVEPALLRAIAGTEATELQGIVTRTLESPDDALRVEALIALTSLGTPESQGTFERRLLVQSPSVVSAVVNRLLEQGRPLSATTLHGMAHRSDLREDAAQLLTRLPRGSAATLFDALLAAQDEEGGLVALLELCTGTDLSPTPVDEGLSSHPSEPVRAGYARCIAHRNAPPDPRTRAMLVSLLSSLGSSDDARTELMILAARNDTVLARTKLSKELPQLPEKFLPASLNALSNLGPTLPGEAFLWAILEDEQRAADTRLQAGALLSAVDAERTRKYVYDRFVTR